MELAGFHNIIDPSAPSGIDLRNEPGFHAVERMLDSAARTERMKGGADAPPATADVDWAVVFQNAVDLAEKGRDLRVLVIAVRAMTNVEGLSGLVAGLNLLSETLDGYWDNLHPLLRDRDDPKDAALRRINALKQLENDDNGLLGDLEMNAILTLPGIGMITGQNLCDASRTEFEAMNEAPSGLGEAEKAKIRNAHEVNQNRVIAACRAVAAEQPELAASLKQDVAAALDILTTLQATFSAKAGLANGSGVSFPELSQFLKRAQTMMETSMVVTDAADVKEAPTAQTQSTPKASAAAPQTGGSGTIQSRDDVEIYLGQIIDFYERTEPSSPIPHLARRMRRMVAMDFMELMSEIAPSGLKEFRNAAGVADDKSK